MTPSPTGIMTVLLPRAEQVLLDGKRLARVRPRHGRVTFSADLTGSHTVELVGQG